MDRNSIIGLTLIGFILFGWIYITAPSNEEIAQRKKTADSLAVIEKQKTDTLLKASNVVSDKIPANSNVAAMAVVGALDSTGKAMPVNADSLQNEASKSMYGVFASASKGVEKYYTLENEFLKATISSKGARIVSVELKNYKTYSGKPLQLFDKDSSALRTIFIAQNRAIVSDSLYFTANSESFSVNKTDSNSISFKLFAGSSDKYLEYTYSLKGNTYLLGFSINTIGLQDIIPSNTNELTLNWEMKIPSQEKSIENQQAASTIYFKYNEDEVDYISETSDETKSFESKIKWLAFKQQFFTSVLIAKTDFEKPMDATTKKIVGSKNYVKEFTSNLTIPYKHLAKEGFDMQFYFGPTHYQTLKEYGLSLEKQVPLGWGILGWVNRFLVIPIFNFLDGFNLNYGIVILILTLIIKALLFPIAYKTYLSSAKMRILKPEVDEINKKFGNDDPLKKQQAMMSLYKKAGVNPMAGCIPLLLQMPILIALFRFFPASIELRQQAFLWADDLSTYDSILDFSFNVPFYGDHISLFTLLMTVSTILYTYSNSQLMATNNDMPGMKFMMYFMPIMFLGIFNNYSAGLSYYYFLANMITFSQTFIMRRFVDEDALHKKIQENKKKPVKVSRWQQRLQDMQKEQQKRLKK
ncbi:MAG: membrane protein insertase YidC [Bacteroidetes bacterium]|nr:membrane protein insertase YidC [Bacteroidota bacterium]